MSNQEYSFRHGPTNTNTTTSNAGTANSNGEDKNTSADLTRSVAMSAHKAVDSITEKAAEAERKIRDSATSNEEALRQAADKSAAKAKELKLKARNYVNENPLTAAGIAFVAGIVTSAWMRK